MGVPMASYVVSAALLEGYPDAAARLGLHVSRSTCQLTRHGRPIHVVVDLVQIASAEVRVATTVERDAEGVMDGGGVCMVEPGPSRTIARLLLGCGAIALGTGGERYAPWVFRLPGDAADPWPALLELADAYKPAPAEDMALAPDARGALEFGICSARTYAGPAFDPNTGAKASYLALEWRLPPTRRRRHAGVTDRRPLDVCLRLLDAGAQPMAVELPGL